MSSDERSTTDIQNGIEISDNTVEDIEKNKQSSAKLRAVVRAFIANIGIAIVKFICFIFSRSSAMLAESIHSAVDSFNSICLMVGIKRGSRPADSLHPFGYGLEANIWAMFASLLMLIGTATAIYYGFDKLIHARSIDELLKHYNYVAFALIVSAGFEAWAVMSAANAVCEETQINELNPLKKIFKSIRLIRKVQSPTTKFVWYEDTSAFFGVLVALCALTISKFIMPYNLAYIPDAIASIIIGIILFLLAIYLLKNNVNSLTVQSAQPRIEEIIRNTASAIHGISKLTELKTIDLGTGGLIVNMTIEVDPETQMKDADDIAQMLERKIKKHVKNVNHVAIELEASDEEDNWEEKLNKLILEGQKIGAIDAHEATMLNNFFSFANTVTKEIMIPRTEIIFIDSKNSIYELADIIISSGHTRIPIYEDNVDNILGVVNAKDVLKVIKNNNIDENFEIKTLARDILIVPENKFISDLLSDFTSSKNQIAAVVDEHGGIAGIITIEDILEEIVGEIYDEFDKIETPEILELDEYTLSVASKTSIQDFNELYDQDIPDEDFQTLGGYVFGLLGREPEIGDVVEDKNITYTILEVDGIKITRIKMHKNTPFKIAQKQTIQEEV
ncbi:cation diffusion facilitator family transporter [bacterium]|nr:cation diffusion facilitator family transporter [bacterium]